jgi:hypothetical protein
LAAAGGFAAVAHIERFRELGEIGNDRIAIDLGDRATFGVAIVDQHHGHAGCACGRGVVRGIAEHQTGAR